MQLRHVASHHFHTLTRQLPALRHLSPTIVILSLVWVFAVYWGERTTFRSAIQACNWQSWEHWPANAVPHHLVFIADPQLVDPHTYPERPWPLSALTEKYTDAYMARNFRLINEKLDPDSIVFLGDLLDGGREWATSRARPLRSTHRRRLEGMGIVKMEKGSEEEQIKLLDGNGRELYVEQKAAMARAAVGTDLPEFVHGENGRWKRWGTAQWESEYERFGRIFFAPDQLYPNTHRSLLAAYNVDADPVNVENGSPAGTRHEYVVAGGKQRRVLTSLPGNHDLGFGSGVQQAVRDRFHSRFGESNRVDVIGNHTIVSLDAVSLAAMAQFEKDGYETTKEQAAETERIWGSGMDFLEHLNVTGVKVVRKALAEYYPEHHAKRGYVHEVTDPLAQTRLSSPPELAPEELQLPMILLSHVPLHRNADTDCGPLRERGHAIPIAGGYQYQNVLTRTLSSTIMQKLSVAGEVVHAFSGDDHDYCDVTHRYNVANFDSERTTWQLARVREITVKSFSWAMGVRKPGFLLVSLWNPVDKHGKPIATLLPTMQTHLCLLPDQLGIFIDYALLLASTLLVLLLRAVVLALRGPASPADDEDTSGSSAKKYSLPRYRSPKFQPNGLANGYSTPNKSDTKGRQRASSTTTSNNVGSNGVLGNGNLGVQRSYNARTRSVSPKAGGYGLPELSGINEPLIDRAGYYPQIRWMDPEEDSDEESHIGRIEEEILAQDDSQAKWKRRRRPLSRARRAVDEFVSSVAVVALPVLSWYVILVRSG